MMDSTSGVLRATSLRQLGQNAEFQSTCTFNPLMARKLQLECACVGHKGCVNRLRWSQNGLLLASASDDKQVMLWHYPDTRRVPLAVATQHHANIFGVAFLPHSDNQVLVTGAMDGQVQVHRLDGVPTSRSPLYQQTCQGSHSTRHSPRRHPDPMADQLHVQTTVYECHKSRVKTVDVDPTSAHVFFSAGEDGFVRQFDTRIRTSDQNSDSSPNALLTLYHGSRMMEVKAVAVNMVRPEQLAVTSCDPYVRIYDRRMLSPGLPRHGADQMQRHVLKMAPPHLTLPGKGYGVQSAFATHVSFGSNGQQVVATYHGDHAYSFDVRYGRIGAAYDAQQGRRAKAVTPVSSANPADGGHHRWQHMERSSTFVQAKQQGDAHFYRDRQYALAVSVYVSALLDFPQSATLMACAAMAMMKRDWPGDKAFALRLCEQALETDPHHADAHYHRCHSLTLMQLFQEAEEALEHFREACPRALNEVQHLFDELEEARTRAAAAAQERAANRHKGRRGAEAGQEAVFSNEAERRIWMAIRHIVLEEDSDDADAAGDMLVRLDDDMETRTRHGAQGALGERAGTSAIGPVSQPCTTPDCSGCGSDEAGPSRAPRKPWTPLWQQPSSRPVLQRYMGQCNLHTDIKEAVFLGRDDALVACGSDDGRVYIHNALTGQPIVCLEADEDVANCVQGHPHLPVLATSGIEHVVRLWAPTVEPSVCPDLGVLQLVETNQRVLCVPHAEVRGPAIMRLLSAQPQLLALLLCNAMASEEVGDGDGQESE